MFMLALNCILRSKSIFVITSLTPFLAETFGDLLKQNFGIYTKTSKLVLTLPDNFASSNNLSLYGFSHEVCDINPLQFHATSYINELLLLEAETNHTQLKPLQQKSRVHPDFYESLSDIILTGYFREVARILVQLGSKEWRPKDKMPYNSWSISNDVALRKGKILNRFCCSLFLVRTIVGTSYNH